MTVLGRVRDDFFGGMRMILGGVLDDGFERMRALSTVPTNRGTRFKLPLRNQRTQRITRILTIHHINLNTAYNNWTFNTKWNTIGIVAYP